MYITIQSRRGPSRLTAAEVLARLPISLYVEGTRGNQTLFLVEIMLFYGMFVEAESMQFLFSRRGLRVLDLLREVRKP